MMATTPANPGDPILERSAMNFSAVQRGVHQHWHAIAALLLLVIASIGVPASAAPASEAFDWAPERAPKGPLVIVISVPSQQALVYRNGVRIGTSSVSTGMQGHETPGGVYRILQKRREHTSNLYDLPMPFMQRLTWDGIALHAGDLPGHPASHGCVLLPAPFAQILFDTTSLGDLVVIAVDDSQPVILPGLGMLTPADAGTGATRARNKGTQAFEWAPERAPAGPLSIVLSTSERQIVVLRNAVEIGRASIDGRDLAPMGTRVYVLLAGTRSEPSRVVPGRPARHWQELSVTAERRDLADAVATGRITVPAEFCFTGIRRPRTGCHGGRNGRTALSHHQRHHRSSNGSYEWRSAMTEVAARLLQLLYFMAPAYLANMAPPFVRYWKGWNRPIHARTLGDHKTVVGYALGVLAAVVTTAVQAAIDAPSSLLDYAHWPWLGLAFGVGAMTGDSLKSYFKRQRGVPPGARWIPFDQLDFVLGALLLVGPFAGLGWLDVLAILLATLIGDIVVNRAAFRLGIKATPW